MGSTCMDEMENGAAAAAAEHARTSSPLSSLHDADSPRDSPAKLPALEDMDLSSAGDKESPSAKGSPRTKESPPTKESPSTKDSPSAAKPPTAKSPKKRKKLVVKRPSRKPRWDAESLLSDPKSPLASAELRTLLTSPMAWDVLDEEEKAEILALFPDNQHILQAGTPNSRPNFASLRNDDSFRHDCAAFTENLSQGRHDPEWLESAWCAHERRKMGDFDDYLETKFKDDWDVELPPEMKSCHGLGHPGAEPEGTEPEGTEPEPAVNGNDKKDEDDKDDKKDQDEAMGDGPGKVNGDLAADVKAEDQTAMDIDQTANKGQVADETMEEAPDTTTVKENGREKNREEILDEIQVAWAETPSKAPAARRSTAVSRPRRRMKMVKYTESSSEDELA